MANAEFSLEKVLSYRREIEKVSKIEFLSAQEEFDSAVKRLRNEENHVDEINSEFHARQREGITADELGLYSAYFMRKGSDIKMQRQDTVSLNDKMSEKREVLIEAVKEKKILETLKDKQIKASQKAALLKERLFMEEIALRKRSNEK